RSTGREPLRRTISPNGWPRQPLRDPVCIVETAHYGDRGKPRLPLARLQRSGRQVPSAPHRRPQKRRPHHTIKLDDAVLLSQRRQRRRPHKTKTRTNTTTPRPSPPHHPRRKTTGQHTPTQQHGSNAPHQISCTYARSPSQFKN